MDATVVVFQGWREPDLVKEKKSESSGWPGHRNGALKQGLARRRHVQRHPA